MKYLVTGVTGQLGFDVVRILKENNENDVLAINRNGMDISNKDEVMQVMKDYRPDVVVHCAAWTNVDAAEDAENVDEVIKTNVIGTRNIAEACDAVKSKLFYISSDYVFDGKKDGIYEINNKTNPINVYGQTKYHGEIMAMHAPKHFILRTSWVFGINGKNFVKTMLKLSESRNEINVIDDQVGSPTYTYDLACLIYQMSKTEKYGTYHTTNSGYCSWAEFAEYIFESNHINMKVNYINSDEYPSKARRPKNSKLSKQSLLDNGFLLLPDWHDAIDRYNLELKKEKVLTKN